ncbi:MAG: hypothetical protein HGA74_18815, partial [Deltaproteobacteria bacterium]|nr:hypothetical protein [Deltaproteobacteria bacterium]
MEARIVRSMSRALEEANAYVWVLSSKEFCPDVAEPFYSPEDILLLLQDAQFKERIKSKRIQYIVLVYVKDMSRGWSTKTYTDPGG